MGVIFEKVSYNLNIIPIAKGQECSNLSPGSLIYPPINESLANPDVKSKMVNINCMIKQMRAYDELAKEISLYGIRSKGSYDTTRSKGKGRGSRVLVPTVGDVVMVSNEDKFNDCKYGKVVEIVHTK